MYLILLTLPEKEILVRHVKTSPLRSVRLRAHALLMRDKGMDLHDISDLVFKSERVLSRWFKDFSLGRLASLFSGHVDNENASKLTHEQKEEIKKTLSLAPSDQGIPIGFWDVPSLKEYVSITFGVVYESPQSYHFLLKFSNLSFKYPDKLSPRRNEKEIEKQIRKVKKRVKTLLSSPDLIVLAADETRVQLEAEIRRAWLVRGKRTVVKTERSDEHQNYLGFLDQKYGICQVFEIERGNQQETIRVLKKLLKQYPSKKVCVVWDNAKWHKGELIRYHLSKGRSLERLHLINFPPYAPEHNPIEHVWQYAKSKIANRSKQPFEKIKQSFLNLIDNHTFSYQI